MTEAVVVTPEGAPGPMPSTDSGGTMRQQLLGASLFPLAFFGLLSILVTATALYEMTTKLVSERNAAEVQALAYRLSAAGDSASELPRAAQQLSNRAGSHEIVIVDASGDVISAAGESLVTGSFIQRQLQSGAWIGASRSILITSPDTQDQIILSSSQIPGTDRMLLMMQPWSVVMTPALSYQLILVGLLGCGTLLSLLMLSVSIGRIIHPITELAGTASRAVPGSIFRPVPERGPIELRALTAAFNRMVIQLAEQQLTMREYAQKALLSQEDERQRLSHELHDGTVQELVGIAQRLELCRGEMESDPVKAKQRLDELRRLAQHTLKEVRQISNALRPSILQDLGLAAALQVLGNDLEEGMPGIRCVCRISDGSREERRLQPDMELAVFRVAQEALTNIRKHAQNATQVSVCLDLGEQGVVLEVKDNGCGGTQVDLGTLVRSGHLGYAGMYERARLFGGQVAMQSDAEMGTSVRMVLPLSAEH